MSFSVLLASLRVVMSGKIIITRCAKIRFFNASIPFVKLLFALSDLRIRKIIIKAGERCSQHGEVVQCLTTNAKASVGTM